MPYTNMAHCFLVQASSFLFCVYVSAISKGAHSNNNDQTGTAAPEAPEQSVITSSPVLSHNEQPAVLQQDPATKQRTQNREQREKEINRSWKTACSLLYQTLICSSVTASKGKTCQVSVDEGWWEVTHFFLECKTAMQMVIELFL